MKEIFLIGMPSIGKTTISVFLNFIVCNNLSINLVEDIDLSIEWLFYLTINKFIFNKRKEFNFRFLEKNILIKKYSSIISTGGAYYYYYFRGPLKNILSGLITISIKGINVTYETRNIVINFSYLKLFNSRLKFLNFLFDFCFLND